MSIQASIAIAVVLLLRLLFAKSNISKKYVMLLWLIPFLCLMIPWRISSPVGIWQNAPSDYGYESLINQEEDTADTFP
jgi:beta-lactamase regulating signal transducer with metallopeptidase domain